MEKDLENHVAGSSAHSASLSSLAGALSEALALICVEAQDHRDNLKLTREQRKSVAETLDAFTKHAYTILQTANEERGVSDSTPQTGQRGSPNTSGASHDS